MYKKLFLSVAGLGFFLPTVVFADTSSVSSVSAFCGAPLTQNLKYGMRDSGTRPKGQITQLQQFLSNQFNLEGMTTGFFGRLTEQNVIRFQKTYGISRTGTVGPLTRAKIIEVCLSIVQQLQQSSSTQTNQPVETVAPVSPVTGTETASNAQVPSANATAPATIVSKPKDVSEFVSGAFSCILKRSASVTDFTWWKDNFVSKSVTYRDLYIGFFTGEEYRKLNTSNQEFVDQLHRCVYYREPEALGRTFWDNRILSATRDEVIREFIGSYEFESNVLPLLKVFNGTN